MPISRYRTHNRIVGESLPSFPTIFLYPLVTFFLSVYSVQWQSTRFSINYAVMR